MKQQKQQKEKIDKLERFSDDFNRLFNDLHDYLKTTHPHTLHRATHNIKKRKRNITLPNTKCKLVNINGYYKVKCVHIEPPLKKKRSIKNRLADKIIDSKIINGQAMAKWGEKWLPVCDGSGFPYVEGCYDDMSNWSSGPKQCIIKDPATPNLASGSLYTCGFLW